MKPGLKKKGRPFSTHFTVYTVVTRARLVVHSFIGHTIKYEFINLLLEI